MPGTCHAVFESRAEAQHHCEAQHPGALWCVNDEVKVYRCMTCPHARRKLYQSRLDVINHSKAAHRGGTTDVVGEWRRYSPDMRFEVVAGPEKSGADGVNDDRFVCRTGPGQCAASFPTRPLALAHCRKQHANTDWRIDDTLLPQQQQQQQQRERSRHDRVRVFRCLLCADGEKRHLLYETRNDVVLHSREAHRGLPLKMDSQMVHWTPDMHFEDVTAPPEVHRGQLQRYTVIDGEEALLDAIARSPVVELLGRMTYWERHRVKRLVTMSIHEQFKANLERKAEVARDVQCPLCPEVTRVPEGVPKHALQVHDVTVNRTVARCFQCGYDFPANHVAALRDHLLARHGLKVMDKGIPITDYEQFVVNVNPFVDFMRCQRGCGFTTVSQAIMSQHTCTWQ